MNSHHSFDPYQHNKYNQQPAYPHDEITDPQQEYAHHHPQEPQYCTQYNPQEHRYTQGHSQQLSQYFSQRRNSRPYTQEHKQYYTQHQSVEYHSQSHQQYPPPPQQPVQYQSRQQYQPPPQQHAPPHLLQKGLNSPEHSLEQRKEAVPPYDATHKHHLYTYSAQEEPRYSFNHFTSFQNEKLHSDIKYPPQPHVEYPAIPPFRSASPPEQKARIEQKPVRVLQDRSPQTTSARRDSSSSPSLTNPEECAPRDRNSNWTLQGKDPPPAVLLQPEPSMGIPIQTERQGSPKKYHKEVHRHIFNPTQTSQPETQGEILLSTQKPSSPTSQKSCIVIFRIPSDQNPGTSITCRRARKMLRHPKRIACTDCGATKSPVWRKGPGGPKTLCNACGLQWVLKGNSRQSEPSGGPSIDDSRQDIQGEKLPSIKELGLPQTQELTPPRSVPQLTPINSPYKHPQPFASCFPPIRMPNYVASTTRGPPILGDGLSQLRDDWFHDIMSKHAEHRQSSEDSMVKFHKLLWHPENTTPPDIGTILLGDCLIARFATTGAKTTLGGMLFPEAFNAGFLGDKIANVLFRLNNWMYDLLKERRVKNWILLAGTNDMNEEGISRDDWERFRLLLWAVLRLSKTGKGGIFVCGLFGRSDVAYEVTKKVNQGICDVVADFNDWIEKMMVYRRIVFIPPPGGINRSNMYPTCLLDAEGYKIWDQVLRSEVGAARLR